MNDRKNPSPSFLQIGSAFAFFIAAALAIFTPGLLKGLVLAPEDNFVQNFPAFAAGGNLWTPLLLSGFPVLADPQVQYFYPVAWLAKHLGADLAVDFNVYVISGFVFSAFFAFLLARRLSGSYHGSLVAGLSYGFSGYLISELKHVQVLHTALWLPVLFYFVERLAHPAGENNQKISNQANLDQALSLLALSLAVAMMIFAGHPQSAFYILGATFAWVIFLFGGRSWLDKKSNLLAACVVMLAIGVGILLASVQLLPSLELSSFSARSNFDFKEMIVGQVEPIQLIGFTLPYIIGGAFGTLGNMPFSEQGPPPGLLFFGFGPILLAGFAGFKGRRQPQVYFFLALLLFAFLLSLGKHTPLALIIYQLPVIGKFRGLYRILLLATFAVAMLSAYGLAKIEADYLGQNPAKQRFDLGRVGALKHLYLCLYIILSCFSYLFFLGSLPFLLIFVKDIPFLSSLAQSLGNFFAKPPHKVFGFCSADLWQKQFITLTVLASLASYAINAEWTKASPKLSDVTAPPLAIELAAKTKQEQSRIFSVAGIEAKREQLPPNLSRLWGVASAAGYEPLISKRYARLLNIAEGGFMTPPFHIAGANLALDMVCVKYLLAPWSSFSARAFDAAAQLSWRQINGAENLPLFENTKVLPRFYLVEAAKQLQGDQILTAIESGRFANGQKFVPSSTVLLEGPGDNSPVKQTSAQVGEIYQSDLSDEKLTFRMRLKQRGYFVLADTYYPGWIAALDGKAVEILKANYVQRAVRVDPGDHTLIMKFEPKSLALGAKISLYTLLAWLLILLLGVIFASAASRSKQQQSEVGGALN